MITRRFLNELHCKACDDLLTRHDLDNYREFDGLCEECYGEAMKAAYEDLDLNDDKFYDED